MSSSAPSPERLGLLQLTSAPDFDAGVNSIVRRVGAAATEAEVIDLLGLAARRLGADSACFVSYIEEDALQGSYRYLLAGDIRWASDYLQYLRFADDPWLVHAMGSVQPVRACELQAASIEQGAMVEAARDNGFRSAVIVPAPAARNEARTAALYLGSPIDGFFECDAFGALKVVARGLAMEIGAWLARRVRDEVLAESRITDAELALLRFEQQGLGSKAIAAVLGIEAKTVDCRFQRLNAKLGTANRKASLRMAMLYELI